VSVDGLARLGKTAESIAVGELADIVAGHDRNRESAHAQARGHASDAVRSGGRVGGAHIGDDRDAPPPGFGQDGFQTLLEQRIEPSVGIADLRLLRDRDGPLRQAFEDDDVEIAAFDELDGRLDAVAGIAGPAADAQRPRAHRRKTPMSTAAAVITSVAANSNAR
jgi:hypothetical protein